MPTLVESCARELLDVAPQLMQVFREEMRAARTPDLSTPQFRTLAWLRRHPGAGLGELAECIGLSNPAMSKLVDGLARRGMVARTQSLNDRRRVDIVLTDAGLALLRDCREAAAKAFALRLANLAPAELDTVSAALGSLRALFQPRAHGHGPGQSSRSEA